MLLKVVIRLSIISGKEIVILNLGYTLYLKRPGRILAVFLSIDPDSGKSKGCIVFIGFQISVSDIWESRFMY